ncbi:MAG: hypothetical protein GXY61_05290 [Lentisphaerae bacterium]|nr:hypothetical protein [Lentisphaerota bacterium]
MLDLGAEPAPAAKNDGKHEKIGLSRPIRVAQRIAHRIPPFFSVSSASQTHRKRSCRQFANANSSRQERFIKNWNSAFGIQKSLPPNAHPISVVKYETLLCLEISSRVWLAECLFGSYLPNLLFVLNNQLGASSGEY